MLCPKATTMQKTQRLRLLPLLLLALMLGASAWVSASANIHDVRMWRSPDNTRIVFDLDQAIEHKVFVLKNPDRVVIDIPRASIKADVGTMEWQGTPVQNLRTGIHNKDTLRVVLDLSKSVQPKSFFLKKTAGFNHRLVIDLEDKAATKDVASRTVAASHKEKRALIIAIDAGHGGEDPGAVGPGNVYEKQVVLAISKELE